MMVSKTSLGLLACIAALGLPQAASVRFGLPHPNRVVLTEGFSRHQNHKHLRIRECVRFSIEILS